MKYVVECSFGKDSLCMLLKMLELHESDPKSYPIDCILYYDNHMEFASVRANAEKMRPILKNLGIRFLIIEPATDFEYEMCDRPLTRTDEKGNVSVRHGYGFCGGGGNCRWATGLKIKALREAYRKIAKPKETIVEYIGIATNERHRISRRRDGNRIQVYPLIEWGMSEADCLRYCFEHDWHWYETTVSGDELELYSLLDRVSCFCCANKNNKELKALYELRDELPYWNRLRGLQARIDRPYKQGKTVYDLERAFGAFEGLGSLL